MQNNEHAGADLTDREIDEEIERLERAAKLKKLSQLRAEHNRLPLTSALIETTDRIEFGKFTGITDDFVYFAKNVSMMMHMKD